MGHVWSKARSLVQISLKPGSSSTGQHYALTFMEIFQKVCFLDILVKKMLIMLGQQEGYFARFV